MLIRPTATEPPPDSEDYRELLEASFREARRRVFGLGALKPDEQNSLAAYENRPVDFTREILGQRTWPGSRATMNGVVKHRQVVVAGPRKSTKSHTSAQLLLAMVCPTPTFAITTASVWTQVREVLWAKVQEFHAKARRKLPGDCFATSLRIAPQWGAVGMSTDKPGRIQGFHSGLTIPDEDADDPMAFDAAELVGALERDVISARLFMLLDECPEIRAAILETLYGSMIGDRAFSLWQGNPTYDPDSAHPFARAMRSGSGFYRIHIAGEEFDPELEPDPADECFHGVPRAAQPQEWRDQRAHDWGGKESPLYRVHVLGLPAGLAMSRQFIPHALIVSQAQRAPTWREQTQLELRHIGWDVGASEEGDPNVALLSVGGRVTDREEWRDTDTMRSCDRVEALMQKWGTGGLPILGKNVHIDGTGVGKGCVDRMRQKGHAVDGVDFGSAPRGNWGRVLTRGMFFRNLKAELCWVVRRAMQEGICLVPEQFHTIWQQAKWHTWKEVPHAEGTALAVAETKKDLKERFGRSPDDFDALLLAWSRSIAGFSLRVVGREDLLG